MSLSAPFPYYGGKSRAASDIIKRLGDVTVYVEPFAGSLAVLLASDPHQREIVCDINGHICNFWRALIADPDSVAYYADYPTIHHDLTARHRWLVTWARDYAKELSQDPEFYDAKAAGWWVWGISSWIGGQWCIDRDADLDQRPNIGFRSGGQGVQRQRKNLPDVPDKRPMIKMHPGGVGVQIQRLDLPNVPDQIPHFTPSIGGRGVSQQRKNLPNVEDRRPHVDTRGYGQGVQMQRKNLPNVPDQIPYTGKDGAGQGVSYQRKNLPNVPDQRPHVERTVGGAGVQVQRKNLPDVPDQIPFIRDTGGGRGVQIQRPVVKDAPILTGDRLKPWFRALSERLANVIVLNRSWESALTTSLLMQTPTSQKPPVGILLDPPYNQDDRSATLYQSDADSGSNDIAAKAWQWALEHGDKYRIAYCAHEGDIEIPDGWTTTTSTFGGIRIEERRERRDLIVYSPACAQATSQIAMW